MRQKENKHTPDWAKDLEATLAPLLTEAEAEKVLDLGRVSIWRLRKLGLLETVRPPGSRKVLVTRRSLLAMLQRSA